MSYPLESDWQMPQSFMAEQEVIGAVLVDQSVIESTSLQPSDFYHQEHQALWRMMLKLHTSGMAIDEVTLMEELSHTNVLDDHRCRMAIAACCDRAGTVSGFESYCSIVKDKSVKRSLVHHGQEVQDLGRGGESGKTAVEKAESALREVSLKTVGEVGTEAQYGMDAHMAHIKSIQDGTIREHRIPTGLKCLDEHLGGGFKGTWQVVITAPSGHGKTSFAVNNCALAAARAGWPVLICSLEMAASDIYARMAAAVSGVPVHMHDIPEMPKERWNSLCHGADVIRGLPVSVVDSVKGSLSGISAAAREFKKKHGRLGLVVVDYLQLMKGGGSDSGPTEDIENNSKGLKHLAMEMDCTTLVLVQPTARAKREGKVTVRDAKGAGSIEDDCDLALSLWRPSIKDTAQPKYLAEVNMDKGRNIPHRSFGSTDVRWSGAKMVFEDIL